MTTKLNKDYRGKELQCFAPEPDFVAVIGNIEFDVTDYSVICFDHTADIAFNDGSTSYVGWPANQPLQLTNRINTVTFSVSGVLMYMEA